jgi:hypothetical protein
MSIPIVAAIIALVGALGLVASALAHAGAMGDLIFSVSSVCLVLAPLIFLGWFIFEAFREIARIE